MRDDAARRRRPAARTSAVRGRRCWTPPPPPPRMITTVGTIAIAATAAARPASTIGRGLRRARRAIGTTSSAAARRRRRRQGSPVRALAASRERRAAGRHLPASARRVRVRVRAGRSLRPLQVFGEAGESAPRPCLDRAKWQSQMLRNLALRESIAVGKPQHDALALRQRLERQPQPERFICRDGELLRCRALVDRINLWCCYAQRAPSVRIERGIARDAADPGARRSARRVECAGMPPDGRERLLRGVLGGLLARAGRAGRRRTPRSRSGRTARKTPCGRRPPRARAAVRRSWS